MHALDRILAAPKITHDLQQGSDAWCQFRLQHRGTSEAAAALGLSKNVTRTELLHAKHTGIAREFSDFVQTRVLDKGHEVEALQRPLMEQELGEDLYPVTCSRGGLSASCDGITLDDDTVFEHKQWNDDLAAMVSTGNVPDEHMPQCQQLLMVTGARRVLFVVSDGTAERREIAEVLPDRAWQERIALGWEQFDKDLAEYVPRAAEPPKPTGRAPETLPALRIEISGQVTASNLAEFKANALAVFAGINRSLTTDAEFADAEKTVKWCGDVEDRLKAAKEHALGQTASIDALFRTIDDIAAESKRVRLDLDKLVKARKEAIRGEIVAEGTSELAKHIAALNQRLGKPYMPRLAAEFTDFGGAVSNKRTVDSLRNAVKTLLASAKIEANRIADGIQVNLNHLREHAKDHAQLFPDTATIVLKAPDDLQALVMSRIAQHKERLQAEAEAVAEAAREKIRKEEQDRADKEAREKLQAEQLAAAAQTMGKLQEARKAEAMPPDLQDALEGVVSGIAADIVVERAAESSKPPPAVVPLRSAAPASPPTMKLGDINALLAPLAITAEGLRTLGFEPAKKERSAVLFHEQDLPRIVEACVLHLQAALRQRKAA